VKLFKEKIEIRIDRFGESIANQLPLDMVEETKETLSAFHWSLSKHILKKQ